MGISHVETHPYPKKILCCRGCPEDLSSIAWLFSGPQAKDVRERAWETKLTGAFYAGNGWVAGGCWDDY